MKKTSFCLTLCLLGSAFGQDVQPPPKPPDNGPSLEVTMKYIQDRLNGEGNVSVYRETITDTRDRSADTTPLVSIRTINALADVASCTLSFTLLSSSEYGQFSQSKLNYKLSFRDVKKLLVEPAISAQNAAANFAFPIWLNPGTVGYTTWLPTTFEVILVPSSGKKLSLRKLATDPKGVVREVDLTAKPLAEEAAVYFREEETAQRMAKAMVHAAELCGGGKDDDDPFK